MNSFYFWDEMAAKCLKSEHFQEAIQSYKHALESTDENADQASVWANIGNVYLTIQDIPAAVDAFLAASRLDPTSYDFDCILERITANGYLDESAMILAKDMYALESVKMGQDDEPGAEIISDEISTVEKFPAENDLDTTDQSPVDASMAEDKNALPVDTVIAVPNTDVDVPMSVTESLAGQEVPGTPDEISETIIVEPASSEETSQPQAGSNEVDPPVEIALAEPVAQTELFATAEEPEPLAPGSIEETNPPVAEVSTEVEVAETAPASETPEIAAEIAILEPVAEEADSEVQNVIEAPETGADTEILPEVAGPQVTSEPEYVEAYIEIPIDEILENQLQLRFSMQSDELVESVRQHGILQPLVVARMDDGKYMVVTGNRRLAAARLAGLEHVPAVVRSANEREFLELALIENIQRVDLDPLELAEAYHLLVENFGLSLDTIATTIGKTSSFVAAAINLLKLSDEGKQALQEKSISEGHARALVAIDLPALQNNALVYVLENRLGVRQTEDLVRIILNAVAVSRSYDESYHEEAWTILPQQESQPVEHADETDSVTPEIESVVETELPKVEPDTAVDSAVEPEVTQTVIEASITSPEPGIIETASLVDAETNLDAVSSAEQPVMLDVNDDAVIDLLVAESEKTDSLVENNANEKEVEQAASAAVIEEENADFYWIRPETEAANQVQQDCINPPAPAELLAEVTLENTPAPVSIPSESIFGVANCDAARDKAIQAEVIVADSTLASAPEPVLHKTEENLDGVIDEIVQLTSGGDSPLSETNSEASTAQTPTDHEPAGMSETAEQNEPESPETRTQLKGLEAIAVYRRVVENNPANVRIWHLLGNLYSETGQYEEAIDCLNRSIELDPGKYTYYYHLGLTLAIARRYPEAIQALEKTIELAPQHILAHCSLAGCYRRIGNETEAQKHIEAAKPKLMQEKAYNRACFESISGNSDQAIELLQIALNTDNTPLEWLLRDPDLDFIRDDPRFEAMVAELSNPS